MPYTGVAVRLHLALFYFYGIYYHWSKRAAGERLEHRIHANVGPRPDAC